jgi:hypothetical protein
MMSSKEAGRLVRGATLCKVDGLENKYRCEIGVLTLDRRFLLAFNAAATPSVAAHTPHVSDLQGEGRKWEEEGGGGIRSNRVWAKWLELEVHWSNRS